MSVVPIEERLAIVEEAKNKAVRQILDSAKTIDMLPEVAIPTKGMSVEVSGGKRVSVENLMKGAALCAAPEWEEG